MLMPAIRAIDYPCRCLWRGVRQKPTTAPRGGGGFEQITSTAPWRRMILHFSHMGLTEARTFTAPQSIRVKENRRRGPGDGQAPREQPEKISSRDQSCFGALTLFQAARAASSRCQGVRIRGPSAVIATVCSKWAASDPSWLYTDQLSAA